MTATFVSVNVTMSICVNTSYIADCKFSSIVTLVVSKWLQCIAVEQWKALSVETIAKKGNEELSILNSSGLHINTETIVVQSHHVTP